MQRGKYVVTDAEREREPSVALGRDSDGVLCVADSVPLYDAVAPNVAVGVRSDLDSDCTRVTDDGVGSCESDLEFADSVRSLVNDIDVVASAVSVGAVSVAVADGVELQ
jgi:hypothetical protein